MKLKEDDTGIVIWNKVAHKIHWGTIGIPHIPKYKSIFEQLKI